MKSIVIIPNDCLLHQLVSLAKARDDTVPYRKRETEFTLRGNKNIDIDIFTLLSLENLQ
jgi:hypothetical protein